MLTSDSGSSAIQPLAAGEESCHPHYCDYDDDDDDDDDNEDDDNWLLLL